MKRLLLFVGTMFVVVANAEPTNTSDSFPLNELMQPDYRYLNSAIYPNTGVYDGDVTVNALYDWDLFSPTAGNYLPANSTTITQCTSGNFCAGATNIHYDSVDQGITACSTLGDNSYTQSAVGSSLETDCYRDCSGNVTIEHATTITGNDYYGVGTDTCTATACENGYHTDNNACGANTLTITWANSDNPNTTCTYGGSITTPATAPTIPGKTFVGWQFAFDLSTITGPNLKYNGKELESIKKSEQTIHGLTTIGTWSVQMYDKATKIRGKATCSAKRGNNHNREWGDSNSDWLATENELINEGPYCWCDVTDYLAPGESIWQPVIQSSRWVFAAQRGGTADACSEDCLGYCSINANYREGFKRALFGISE